MRLSDPKALCTPEERNRRERGLLTVSPSERWESQVRAAWPPIPSVEKRGSQSPLSFLPQTVPAVAKRWEGRGLGEVEKEARGP